MEQQIRFCTTSDGVRIAYATAGQGPPLVIVPSWLSHLELDLRRLVSPIFFQQLATSNLLVRYDKRGMGLSSRNIADYSLEAQVRDLHTIIEHLQLGEFTLFGSSQGGTISIAYTVEHPERVSQLILFSTYHHMPAKVRDTLGAVLPLVREDWAGLGTAPLLEMFVPGASPEVRDFFAHYQREAANGEDAAAILEALAAYDVTAALSEVQVPTLVLHRRDDRVVSVQQGREIASLIPDARFVPLEGQVHLPYWGDTEPLLRAIQDFLGQEYPLSASKPPSGFATILFTDMEGSTTLADRLGDAVAQEVRRAHNDIVRSALAANGGNEIKHTGDGIMASFATASSALDAAIAIQRGVAEHKQEHPDSPLGVYIGLNADEPIAEEDPDGRVDLFGTSVNLAARICDHAEAGQILAANVVRELAAGKQFLFADLGETELRGFEDSVKLWELRWQPEGSP